MKSTAKKDKVKAPDKIEDVIPEVRLGNSKILFLDVSSSCTGFSVASVDFLNRKAEMTKAGAIWFGSSWDHPRKYDYVYNMIQNYFDVQEQIDLIIVEQYSVNTDKMSGVLVSPELHGVIKAAAFSNGVKVTSILPQSWRALLQIKPTITMVGTKKKKDYKTPTKDYINSLYSVPDEVLSNITGKLRQTPSDVYDAMAIGEAWLQKYNIKTIERSNCTYDSHIGDTHESVD